MKYGAIVDSCAGSPRVTIGFCLAASASSRVMKPSLGHPLERVVAAPQRRLHVDVGALPHVALDDAGDERRFLELEIGQRLAEVDLRGRRDAVGAVPPVDLIAVEREDLFLRVALLDLDGDDQLLELALRAAIADGESDLVARRACAPAAA